MIDTTPILLPLQALACMMALIVVVCDFYARRVPNALLAIALAIGVLWQVASIIIASPADPNIGTALLGLVIGLVTMLPFYAIRWMGAGDVKFFATLGFLLGAKALLPIWIIGSALCGVHACAVLALRAAPRWAPQVAVWQDSVQASAWYQRILAPRQGRQGLPYAAYLGIGTLVQVLVLSAPGS
jgi:prepilin peptidase CpaA